MSNSLRTKMWKAMAESPIFMIGLNKNADHSEPMHAQLDKDASGHFWFYTTKDNRIAEGGKAMAQYSSIDHELFACIGGHLVEETDQDIIDKYWSKKVEAWYKEGKTDPSLKMMRFELDNAEVWTQDPSFVGMLKLSTGATIAPHEMGEHEKLDL